jgi:hypothetical protein
LRRNIYDGVIIKQDRKYVIKLSWNIYHLYDKDLITIILQRSSKLRD